MFPRLEICTPLRFFLSYLTATLDVPQPVTLAAVEKCLNDLSAHELILLLGGLQPGDKVQDIGAAMQQDLMLLLERNPLPVLVEDFFYHHPLLADAWRN